MNVLIFDSLGHSFNKLYRWDKNQKIIITGVPLNQAYKIHFTNVKSKISKTETPTVSGENLIVQVPNDVLADGENVIIYLYQQTETDAYRTLYTLTVPLINRAQPSNY